VIAGGVVSGTPPCSWVVNFRLTDQTREAVHDSLSRP
jgi:hypothetical protein